MKAIHPREVAQIEMGYALAAIADIYRVKAKQARRVAKRKGLGHVNAKWIDELEQDGVSHSGSRERFVEFCRREIDRQGLVPYVRFIDRYRAEAADLVLPLLKKLKSLEHLALSYPNEVIKRARALSQEAKRAAQCS